MIEPSPRLVAARSEGGSPRVVISAPLFNKALYLPLALESLVAQTFDDFAMLLIDDASDDETATIARRFCERDSRITYVRNEKRIGMLENTRLAYRLARETFPGAPYWALGSDHDIWEPEWLERLTATLDEDERIVLAYPQTQRIDADGVVIRGPWTFDPYGIVKPRERFVAVYRGMVAGDMIYGLFRTRALDRVGMYRAVLVPDRLLLSELALLGHFKQVPSVLWSRRFRGLADLDRQRRAFFLEREPLYLRLPWWIVQTAAVFGTYVVRGRGRPEIGRLEGARFTWAYFQAAFRHRAWRRKNRLVKDYQRATKRHRRALRQQRRQLKHIRASLRRRFIRTAKRGLRLLRRFRRS